jgi:hypothetical protein
MLKEQLDAAHRKVQEHSTDLMFLRDQITTTEVNQARCFNYDVVMRKKRLEEESENSQIQKDE